MIVKMVNKLPIPALIILSLTLGLAPFVPEPHLLEKIRLLLQGNLQKPVDIFDLTMHGLPVFLLALRLTTALLFNKIRPD